GKPLRPQELFDAIQQVLRAKPVECGTTSVSDGPDFRGLQDLGSLGSHPPSKESEAKFDGEAALSLAEGDIELLERMTQAFEKQAATLLNDIGAAIRSRDHSVLERAAHKLKGSVGSFAAGAAFETALELERRGRDGNLANGELANLENL